MKADCFLLLGANTGDRRTTLRRAIRALPGKVLAVSKTYETSPVGPRQRDFLNVAVKLSTALSPMGLLVECKRLEALAGRKPGPRWGPRPLDIDILTYGDRRLDTRWLTIPHPRMSRRAFVLAPLCDIAPGFKPLLRRLNPGPETVKIYQEDER